MIATCPYCTSPKIAIHENTATCDCEICGRAFPVPLAVVTPPPFPSEEALLSRKKRTRIIVLAIAVSILASLPVWVYQTYFVKDVFVNAGEDHIQGILLYPHDAEFIGGLSRVSHVTGERISEGKVRVMARSGTKSTHKYMIVFSKNKKNPLKVTEEYFDPPLESNPTYIK